MMLRLQINTRGAWKDLVQFEPERRAEVLRAAGLFASVLGQEVKWCIVSPEGEREWLRHGLGPWKPITDLAPAPLVDVLISLRFPGDDESIVYQGYRKNAGSDLFYASGDTSETVLRGAYAWTESLDPAPMEAQQVAA